MKLEKIFAFLFFLLVVFLFFKPFFLKGFVPLPTDIIAGVYYPWLNEKWGYPVGVPVKNPILTDAVSQFWIWRNLAIEGMKNGQILWWNLGSASGSPLNPLFHSAAFSPLNIFFFLFDKEVAMSLVVISQPFLAMIFTYLFLRILGLGIVSSLLGGVVFAFSGFMTVWMTWGTTTAVGMFLPLVLFLWEKFLRTKKWHFITGEILVLSFSLYNAHAQTFFYLIAFWSIYVFWRLKRERARIRLALLGVYGMILFFFLLFNAYVLLPAFEVWRFSIRESEGILKQVNYAFLPISNLIKFLAPDYFGNHSTGNFWGKLNYQEYPAYFGLLPLVLACFSLGWKNYSSKAGKRETDFWQISKFFLVVGLVCLAFSFKYPFGFLIYRLNLPLLAKAPAARILYLVGFCGAVLAAFGLEKIIVSNKIDWLKKLKFFWAVILGVGLGSFIVYKQIIDFPQYETFSNLKFWGNSMRVGLRNLAWPTLILFGSSIIFVLRNIFKKWPANFWAACFLLLSIIELFRFGRKSVPFVPKGLYFPSTPVFEFLKNQDEPFRIERERGPLLPPNMWLPYGLESASTYDPILPLGYGQFFQRYAGRKPNRYLEMEKTDWEFFDLLNVKYFLALKTDPSGHYSFEGKVWPQLLDKFKPIFEEGAVSVLENKDVFPRAFLLKKDYASWEGDSLELQNLKSAVLGQASYKRLSFQSFMVETEASEEARLFVSSAAFPGWKVLVDGRQASLDKISWPFLSILLPAGKHQLVFDYWPGSFKIGLEVSLLGIILLIISLWQIAKRSGRF